MSYLDLPRINFTGKFQASPATVNNTPNNFNPANYNQDSLEPENIELYWEPKGDSIFDLNSCLVTTVEAPGVTSDPLQGSNVAALYTGAPPKIVDLDPMQQNGSEVWGLTMMIGSFGGPNVQGLFTPVAFNGIWQNSQGQNTPRSSASGSAVYQSTLTNLKWNVGNSTVLQKLQAASPNRLSIRMVVSAHNNAPQLYAFTPITFETMQNQGVPTNVLTQLVSLQKYVMNVDSKGNPAPPGRGYIPTQNYVAYLLEQCLGQSVAQQYQATILAVTKQPYAPWINYSTGKPLPEQPLYDFNYGQVVGSIGPCLDDEPTYAVPARTLAQVSTQTPFAWWAQAKLDLTATPPSLTLDLANSLPVELPGRPLWSAALGTLSLATYTVSPSGQKTYTTIVPSLDYTDPGFITQRSGLCVLTTFTGVDPSSLATLPLALQSTVAGTTTTLLEENSQGLSMRANQFIFRMNPGMTTTPAFPRGETNTVEIYVRKFGNVEGTDAWQVSLNTMLPPAAVNYTLGTLGTSGTNGINASNLSTPEGKLELSPAQVPIVGGKATLTITGHDPGNPRGYVDGQVYFTTYTFSPTVTDYNQDPNDLLSAQIYQQHPIDGTPTWQNGIGDLLRQYGMLYPIMGRFQLWTYEGVAINREKILRVLTTDISQPLHMPVSRDLSEIRTKLVVGWLESGMPYGPIGPVGGSGTPWDNGPTVTGWGPITSLLVRSGDIIDGLQASYGSRSAPFEGGPGGSPNVIDLSGETIVAMSGYTGVYFGTTQVAQLTFRTASGKTFGPYGTMANVAQAQSFDVAAPQGGAIQSFFGTTITHTNGDIYVAGLGGNVRAG